jgi:flagellar biosynthesis anti-sigma factor FlgM
MVDSFDVKENAMKITQKGPADAELARVLKNDKPATAGRAESDGKAHGSGDSARVDISPEARQLQRIAELARTGDDLRAEKVKSIKERIDSGTYSADPVDVARSIARSEVGRLMEKK